MITFRSWLRRQIVPALVGVGTILLIAHFIVLAYLFYTRTQHQQQIVNRFVNLGIEAVSYHQNRMLDNMAALALDEVGLKQAAICNTHNEILWSYPQSQAVCVIEQKGFIRNFRVRLFSNLEYPIFIANFSTLGMCQS